MARAMLALSWLGCALAPLPRTPNATVTPVFSAGEGGAAAYRLPGLLQHRGVTLACAVQRTLGCTDHKSGVHNIVLKRSTDSGRSFGPLTTIVDTAALWGPAEKCGPAPCMGGVATNPTMVADNRSGEVLLFFSHTNSSMEHATHHGSGPVYEKAAVYPDATEAYVMASTDLGASWAKPAALAGLGTGASPLCGLTPAGGHGVQLSSGRLLVPGYHIKLCTKDPSQVVEEAHAWLSSVPKPAAAAAAATRTWKLSPGFGTGVAEPSYVELYGSTAGQPPPVRATFRVDAPASCDCQLPPPLPPPVPGRTSNGSQLSPPWVSGGPYHGRSVPVRKCRRTAVSTDEGCGTVIARPAFHPFKPLEVPLNCACP
eukprot:SAG22_NODE_1259_length_4983_cov_2.399877_1_plen_370_part_00